MAVEVKKSAFPTGNVLDSGMTLMDYFAGQSLAGLTADPNVPCANPQDKVLLARLCYSIAQAMMEERKAQ